MPGFYVGAGYANSVINACVVSPLFIEPSPQNFVGVCYGGRSLMKLGVYSRMSLNF